METRLANIKIKDLNIDGAYQRAMNENFINAAISNFDEVAIGVIHVAEREDGSLWVIDGQHRIVILKAMHLTDVDAKIYSGLSQADEAARFVKLNTDTSVHPFYRWRARKLAGDPLVLEIDEALTEVGYKLVTGRGAEGVNNLNCVAAIEKSFNRYGKSTMQKALRVISAAWPESYEARNAIPVQGAIHFAYTYPNVTEAQLIDRMSRTDVMSLEQYRRRSVREVGGSGPIGFSRAMLYRYNFGMGEARKLPNLIDL